MSNHVSNCSFLSWLCLLVGFTQGGRALTIPKSRANIYIPSMTSRLRAHVPITIDGLLQAYCSQISPPEVTQMGQEIHIKQNSEPIAKNLCVLGEDGHEHMWRKTFTQHLDLGTLDDGEYSVIYELDEQVMAQSQLTLAPYNADLPEKHRPIGDISQVHTLDPYRRNQDVFFFLKAELPSHCYQINNKDMDIYVDHKKKIIEIEPITSRHNLAPCTYLPHSQLIYVNLGRLPLGRYLIVVRTLAGPPIRNMITIENTDL